MTTEQLIIYLYGVWPDGGFTAFYLVGLFLSLATVVLAIASEGGYDSIYEDSKWHIKKYLCLTGGENGRYLHLVYL